MSSVGSAGRSDNASRSSSVSNNNTSRATESNRSISTEKNTGVSQSTNTPDVSKSTFEAAGAAQGTTQTAATQGINRSVTNEVANPTSTTRTAEVARNVARTIDNVPVPTPRPDREVDAAQNPGAVEAAANAVANDKVCTAADPKGVLSGIEPTGASKATARQDKIKQGGVEASQTMAQTDFNRVMAHKDKFEELGQKYDLPPAVLAGIASRETRGGAILDKQGYGKYDPNGYGLMQVDKQHHTVQGTDNPASMEHLDQATSILSDFHNQIKDAHPDWSPEQQLQAAVASYNKGPSSLRKESAQPENFDRGTTGGDYSNDVLARAQHFAANW
ncbi:MAG: transglycosylase SLT domain-containing protein [Myxococcales bacterium]|nr:transglycosylase SLT domain-containing protein [Myxococcales bacterium]